ncbi:MAG TPA: hypothetical protein VMW50_12895 [Dehalococcoidia bacterium]|nr:hypothetical protein [Dehalococcoidia bacterium]
MKSIMIATLVLLAGCTGPSAREDYYAAVQAAAAAQAQEASAKYLALSTMATTSRANGDNSATVAAVMAIALSQYTPVQPAYIESTTLKWAQVLVGPITTLGALSIQSDLSRDLSRSNRDLGIARIEADAATDQALYGLLATPAATPADIIFPDINIPPAPPVGISDAALGNIINGLVDISGGIQAVSTTGYQTIEDIVANQNVTLENVVDGLQPIITPVSNPFVINQPVVITPVVNAPVFQPF